MVFVEYYDIIHVHVVLGMHMPFISLVIVIHTLWFSLYPFKN